MCSCWRCVMDEASVTGSKRALTGTFRWKLWDCGRSITHRPPGLHGTLWDTVPAAGTWASPPDPRPSNKPSRQICSDKNEQSGNRWYIGFLTFWSIGCQLCFLYKCGCGEEDTKINQYYYLLAVRKWKEAKVSHLDFTWRLQLFVRAYENTSANTEISCKYLCYPTFKLRERGNFIQALKTVNLQ